MHNLPFLNAIIDIGLKMIISYLYIAGSPDASLILRAHCEVRAH